MIVTLHDVQPVFVHALSCHVPGASVRIASTSYLQAFALTYGVHRQAGVLANHFSGIVDDVAWLEVEVSAEKVPHTAFADEAYSGAIGLFVDGQAVFGG